MGKSRSLLRRALAALTAMFVALGVVLAGIAPTAAYAGEAEVRATAAGVFKFNWRYDGVPYSRGSCFLINEDHVLTSWHCAMFSSKELEELKLNGVDLKELIKKFDYTVNIHRDVQIGAELVAYSEEEDWAVFKLEQTVGDTKPFALRDSQTVEGAETVWALGFPASSDLKAINTYDVNDVTFRRGTVSKREGLYQGEDPNGWIINGNFIQTDCPIGGAGGPMTDDNGYVIGICDSYTSEFYLGVATHDIMEALDRLQIEYRKVGPGPEPQPVSETLLDKIALDAAIEKAEALDKDEYTEDSYEAVADALETAKDASALTAETGESESSIAEKQATIDSAAKGLNDALDDLESVEGGDEGGLSVLRTGVSFGGKQGPNWLLIGGIAAGVLVIAGVAAALIVRSRKRKKAAVLSGANLSQLQVQPGGQPSYGTEQQPERAPQTRGTTLNDPRRTMVMFDDGGAQTTVLGEEVYGGYLTRESNNERIDITRSEFTIGRDAASVDYCIRGNGSISRVHARILVRGGEVFIVDNRTSNGTYVNNAKVRPGVEQRLKSGDIVRLSDEKFRYTR